MNHLAHFFLSFEQESLLVGNYMADFAKGSSYLSMIPEIQQGVLLHRFIDHYTDKHSLVKKSIARISNIQGRFTPIVMDVFYDYILANQWTKYDEKPLREFAKQCYLILENHKYLFPKALLMRFEHMKSHDWLSNYKTIYGIEQALLGLSKRTKFDNEMGNAIHLLLAHEKELTEDFNSFFPNIIKACHSQIWTLKAREMPVIQEYKL